MATTLEERQAAAQRQAKRQEKLRLAIKELEVLEFDCRAASRILAQVIAGLSTVAVSDPNQRVLTSAIAQIESAMLLISSDADRTKN